MPLYEYICQECNNRFEKRVSFSEADDDQECPVCGSSRSKKQISLFASTNGTGSGNVSSSSSCGGSGRFT
ncbi:MAG: zinc ribbon domain-containing protein [Chloroflexi bacterium]|jgi:putative FmdB family regulatory protein|nr:zinc ribbon domain-containing protein [Chloroflexota bacterium]